MLANIYISNIEEWIEKENFCCTRSRRAKDDHIYGRMLYFLFPNYTD